MSWYSSVLWKRFEIGAVAPAARPELIVEFMTTKLSLRKVTRLWGDKPVQIATKIA